MSRTGWVLGGVAGVVAATTGVVAATTGAGPSPRAARLSAADTAAVQRGALSAMVSQAGVLTYRAGPDGVPFVAVDDARGTYTELPAVGDEVACGEALYRVDDEPVLLLCGPLPLYRTLRVGARGRDVRQLNRQLHHTRAGAAFTAGTKRALEALQRREGARPTGRLTVGDAVVLPEAVRVAEVIGQAGGPARPGAPVLRATTGTQHVRVELDPSQQGAVEIGDRAQVTLPDGTRAAGRVEGFGGVAEAPAQQGGEAVGATIPTSIELDDPAEAGALDQAPVQVDITTRGVDDALSVPATALLGRSGGGFAVEVARAGGRRELVAVRVGLFDTGGGRVQVEGRLRERDLVVVPSA